MNNLEKMFHSAFFEESYEKLPEQTITLEVKPKTEKEIALSLLEEFQNNANYFLSNPNKVKTWKPKKFYNVDLSYRKFFDSYEELLTYLISDKKLYIPRDLEYELTTFWKEKIKPFVRTYEHDDGSNVFTKFALKQSLESIIIKLETLINSNL